MELRNDIVIQIKQLKLAYIEFCDFEISIMISSNSKIKTKSELDVAISVTMGFKK